MWGFDPILPSTLLILAAGGNTASTCIPPKPAEINVIPRTEEVKLDYSKSMAQLQATQTDTIDPYDFHGVSVTQGFMSGAISMKPSVKLNYEIDPRHGGLCLWYESIDIEISIDPTIVIASEVYEDKCTRKATKDHEMKHVMVDREIVNKYARSMGKKVFDGLSERGFVVGPVDPKHGQDIAEKMQKTVFQIVDFEYQKMGLERMERQRAVDSREEYDRVDALCPDTGSARAALKALVKKSR